MADLPYLAYSEIHINGLATMIAGNAVVTMITDAAIAEERGQGMQQGKIM